MTADLSPAEHRDVLLDLFTQVTETAAQLNLSPVGVHIRTYEVYVQIGGKDMAAVDVLADAYGLPPERDDPYENYDRTGNVEIAGHTVRFSVYSGRPEQPTTEVPSKPAPVRYFDPAKSRAWVAANYSAESKRLVEFGEEATPEDQAAYAAADAAGLFDAEVDQ